ncbi:hypothetical protein GGR57DRAFT_478931 [Xylariaceae sp. FL1272]|nr:hypothetical protein GGR57DRAFT_478931 [Xylariaceae sp. FL1272]
MSKDRTLHSDLDGPKGIDKRVTDDGDIRGDVKRPRAERQRQSESTLSRPIHVSPAEAARRRLVAIELLTGQGIIPSSLSTEQFGIFAHQHPNLQSTSLDMFAKYGAERLRIVHADEKQDTIRNESEDEEVEEGDETDSQSEESETVEEDEYRNHSD